MPSQQVAPILVLGVGNPLMGDEGIGVRVVETLMNCFDFGPRVEVVDAGTMGVGMIHLLRDRDYLLVLDAVDGTGHPPGTIVRMEPDDMATSQVMHSLHDQKLSDVLAAAKLTGIEPEVDFVGVQIERIEQWVTELTASVEQALPDAVAAVLDILSARGIRPALREDPSVEGGILEAIRRVADIPDGALEP
jgi:hydrogenase maturation protease